MELGRDKPSTEVRNQDESSKGQTEELPRLLGAELFIATLLLGLGVSQMFSKFNFEETFLHIPTFILIVSLLILVVWEAQLFKSWEHIYKRIRPGDMALNGLGHTWGTISLAALTYLVCKYYDNFFMVLTLLSIIVLLDLLMSYFDFRSSRKQISTIKNDSNFIFQNTNLTWIKRDIVIWIPFMVIGWGIHYFGDGGFGTITLSLSTSLLVLISILFLYILDLVWNNQFYGTEALASFIRKPFLIAWKIITHLLISRGNRLNRKKRKNNVAG